MKKLRLRRRTPPNKSRRAKNQLLRPRVLSSRRSKKEERENGVRHWQSPPMAHASTCVDNHGYLSASREETRENPQNDERGIRPKKGRARQIKTQRGKEKFRANLKEPPAAKKKTATRSTASKKGRKKRNSEPKQGRRNGGRPGTTDRKT